MHPLDGPLIYKVAHGDTDLSTPFVIEVAMAWLTGGTREIWSSTNFTPNYADPFGDRLLKTTNLGAVVAGVRGYLEAYGISESTSIVVFVHLICPNIEYSDFSKTQINHIPFKDMLALLLDQAIGDLQKYRDEQELQVKNTVFEELEIILQELKIQGRFVREQLIAKLQSNLQKRPHLVEWLARPDATIQLQSFVAAYDDSIINEQLAETGLGSLVFPAHPESYFALSPYKLPNGFLSKNHVNKVLYLRRYELEPVILENNWLCELDMALLRNPFGIIELPFLLSVLSKEKAHLIIVIDAGDDTFVEQFRTWQAEHGSLVENVTLIPFLPVGQTASLLALMPGELRQWLEGNFNTHNISLKAVPSIRELRQGILETLDQLLLAYFWQGISQQFNISNLIIGIKSRVKLPHILADEKLDEKIMVRLQTGTEQDYSTVCNQVVEEFFGRFIEEHGDSMTEIVRQHFRS